MAVLCTVMVLTGCGKSNTAVSSTAEGTSQVTESGQAADSEASEGMDASYDSAPTTSETTSEASDFADFVTLADYKGIRLTAPEGTAIEKGMTANIDYTGKIDGQVFEGGSATGYDLKIGSGSFIDNFEDQLVGHKKGEQVTVTVTFPSDYSVESLDGKEAVFDCTINEIYVQTKDEAVQKLVQDSRVTNYPSDLIQKWTNFFEAEYEAGARTAGQTVEEYMQSIGYTKEMTSYNIKTFTKTELVAMAVMKAEGITRDSQEYKDAAEGALSDNGLSSAEMAASYGISEDYLTYLTEYRLLENVVEKYAV